MTQKLISRPLDKEGFAEFGEVIEKAGSQNFAINNGNCIRHNALARAEVAGPDAEVIINIFSGQPYKMPLVVKMVERHPLGSQAFYPLGNEPWVVIVCRDDNGKPVQPQVFLASANQGINIGKGVWHGVLTPLNTACDFLVVDRGGPDENLEEYHFDESDCFIVDVP